MMTFLLMLLTIALVLAAAILVTIAIDELPRWLLRRKVERVFREIDRGEIHR